MLKYRLAIAGLLLVIGGLLYQLHRNTVVMTIQGLMIRECQQILEAPPSQLHSF